MSHSTLCWQAKPHTMRTEWATWGQYQTTPLPFTFLIHNHNYMSPEKEVNLISTREISKKCLCTFMWHKGHILVFLKRTAMHNTLHIQYEEYTYNCVLVSACTDMFHTAELCVLCNYLLMCHSVRQSSDPWRLLKSPENSLRLSHASFKIIFNSHLSQRV